MKKIYKFLLWIALFWTMFGIIYCSCLWIKKMVDVKDNIIENIGKKIIIQKDTLIILDYSMLNSNYKLSNGTDVSFEFVGKVGTLKK